MPCSDAGYRRTYTQSEMKAKVDEVTRLLCMACDLLVRNGITEPEVDAWRLAHEEQDRTRLERELQQSVTRRRQSLEADILALESKLSKYRAELEGIKG